MKLPHINLNLGFNRKQSVENVSGNHHYATLQSRENLGVFTSSSSSSTTSFLISNNKYSNISSPSLQSFFEENYYENSNQLRQSSKNGGSVLENNNHNNTSITSSHQQQNSTPRTITILNNSSYNDCNFLYYADNDYENDIDYNINIDNFYNNLNIENYHDYENDFLFNSYAKMNDIIINNTQFLNSFSSINSSFDTYSTPPMSRSNSPIKKHNYQYNYNYNHNYSYNYNSNFIDSKILKNSSFISSSSLMKAKPKFGISTLNSMNLNLSLNLLNSNNLNCNSSNANCFTYNLEFSPFTNDRIHLIRDLISKEDLNLNLVNTVLNLLKSSNLTIKLEILKNFTYLDNQLINLDQSDLNVFWNLKIASKNFDNFIKNLNLNHNSNSTSNTNIKAYALYEFILKDFINLMSLMDSIAFYILNTLNNITQIDNNLEKVILLNFYNCMDTNTINQVKHFAPAQIFANEFLHRLIFFLWKTEDSKICNNFRSLSNLA
jgi:hypothetical protein